MGSAKRGATRKECCCGVYVPAGCWITCHVMTQDHQHHSHFQKPRNKLCRLFTGGVRLPIKCLSYPCRAKDCKSESHSSIEEDGIPNTLFPVPPTMQGNLNTITKLVKHCKETYAVSVSSH